MRQVCDTTCDKITTRLATFASCRVIGKSKSTPLPACRNGMLFDNSLNDKRFRIDIRVENGYKEGCTRGAR